MEANSKPKPAAMRVHPDATDYSGLSRTRLYELMKANEIEAIRVGKRRLVITRSIDDFISRQPRAA